MNKLKEVELVATGLYLPGNPIPFDNLENVIGKFDDAPPLVKRMNNKLRHLAKDLIGIEHVHYAVDPKTKELTESGATMSAKAIRAALEKSNMKTEDIDCLLFGSIVPDYQTPPTSTLVQEELGLERCAEMEIHSNCAGMSKMLEIAYDSIRVGRYKNIVISYSQLSSAYLLSNRYNEEKVAVENLLLRWFLCDSASALILRGRDKVDSGIKLEYVFNESIGGKMKPGMWLKVGGRNLDLLKTYAAGLHHFGQDYRMANDFGPECFTQAFNRIIADTKIKYEDIDYILATLPSRKLWNFGKQEFEKRYGIAPEKWFSNVPKIGYSGGSSVIIALDELIKKGVLEPNQNILSIIFESSKWMIGGFVLSTI